jgi:acyl-CoA dehydrogenase
METLGYKIVNLRETLKNIREIGEKVIRPAATSVDRDARFPHEALEALRKERLLAAYIPVSYGGLGYSVSELIEIGQTLAQYCASTAMIWAMHQIQIACLVQHAHQSLFFQSYLQEAAERQLLLASITSEVGIGGDIRSSIAALESIGEGRYRLDKKSTAISYGAYADGFLATARRSPEATSGDQVLVLLRREDIIELKQAGTWDTFGMRGTCSPGFEVSSTFAGEQILETPFADIAPQTMVPFSHLLWSCCWQGIATDALARAQKFMQGKARQQRATSLPGDGKLVEAAELLQLMRANIKETALDYEDRLLHADNLEEALADVGFAIKLNNVKTLSSQLVVQIVQLSLMICGIIGYKEDSPFSIARHIRDAFSAPLMISNERLYTTNAALLLVHKNF